MGDGRLRERGCFVLFCFVLLERLYVLMYVGGQCMRNWSYSRYVRVSISIVKVP
jgi:hypothetical protein